MPGWDIDDDWPDQQTSGQVLVVDDDPSVRSLLAFIFDDEGFDVVEAADGREAIEVLTKTPPSLMILDLMMPVLDGVGVLREREAKRLAAGTRIIVLTAKNDAQDTLWCWELGADQFLTKPVDPDRLLAEGRALLSSRPDELRERRNRGLADARRLEAIEAAFRPR